MRFAMPRRRTETENTLPLINVVFLLLIFFMVAGRLSESDPFVVTPPFSSSETPPGERDLVLHVDAGGQIALEGRPVAVEALAGEVERLLPEGGTVRLKADGAAEAGIVVAAMEALRDAGVERLHLLTVLGTP